MAAAREAFEEAGIPPSVPLRRLSSTGAIAVEHFRDRHLWDPALMNIPEYSFGVDITALPIVLSREHSTVAWLDIERALAELEWESNRTALRELHARLAGAPARSSELVDYYRARASEYEKVYAKPERQADLAVLHELVPDFFAGRHVLEIACGTGYWTRRIGARAASIIAVDLAPETLDVARRRQPGGSVVEFRVGDAFDLAAVPGTIDAVFAGFWWSHVRREELQRFLTGVHRRLVRESPVLMLDNRYVEGSNWPISRTDAGGNTYQRRRLESGEKHEVLKNFPTPIEVHAAVLNASGSEPVVTELAYYWYATYSVGGAG